jgi:hypothetical protein
VAIASKEVAPCNATDHAMRRLTRCITCLSAHPDPNTASSLADHVGQVQQVGGDVVAEGVRHVVEQALNRPLAGDERLHGEADKGNHREAAVLDLRAWPASLDPADAQAVLQASSVLDASTYCVRNDVCCALPGF